MMRTMEKSLLAATLALTLGTGGAAFAAKGGGGGGGGGGGAATLDAAETTHLNFMREEEKLARDVYITLGEAWPSAPAFQNIQGAEQTHTDSVKSLIVGYGLPDPNTDMSVGTFTGPEWGWYFDEKYAALIAAGSTSELDALYVGAFIEELDMHDIVSCPVVIVDTDNGVTDCGLDYTDQTDIANVYTNLVSGSEDHLRAYVGAIEAVIGYGNYIAQYLSQKEVDTILGR